jgi:predicted P-loop ATPase
MTKELVKKCSQKILKPIVKNDFVLMLDSWQGHNKQEIYDNIFGSINCNLQVIPAGTTSYIQPLD